MITQEYLISKYKYHNDGFLIKIAKNYKRYGERFLYGSVTKIGYRKVSIKNKLYFYHRAIFLYHHGYLPKNIDHIDGNPLNNKIENLRPTTLSENQQNVGLVKRNTSGYKNVSWHKIAKKWGVRVQCNGIGIYLGLYDDIELADLVAQEARHKYHKSFAKNF